MSYRSKRDVLASVKERRHERNGEYYTIFEAYLGRDNLSKKQIRLSSKSLPDLKKEIADFYAALDSGGAVAVTFNPYEAADARQALDLLAANKITLSLTECVRRVVSGQYGEKPDECRVTVREAWAKYQDSIAGKSELYVKTITSRVGRWVVRFGLDRKMSEVTAVEVKQDLMENVYKKDCVGSWTTYNKVLGDIKTFVHWCASIEQQIISSDPLQGMKKMDVPWRDPEYMKAALVEKLFAALWEHRQDAPEDLAYAILFFMCGMRMAEIERVKEGKTAVIINLKERFIRVIKCKGSTRGIRPRTFKIPDQAFAWMSAFDFETAIMIPNDAFRKHMMARAKEIGLNDLPKNAGRHTFITMFEAVHHDASALSAIVGNTEDIRAKAYNGVELEDEGRKFFAILPPQASELQDAAVV